MENAQPITPAQIEQAINTMLAEYRDNAWLLNEHWPLMEPHVRMMIVDLVARFPPKPHVRLLDVGCFNGYLSYLFNRLGYRVTGTDIGEIEERRNLFAQAGIEFVPSNMNKLNPFVQIEASQFEIIIISQVIEHILNHPRGLIRSLYELMRPGGVMILTTPNPATIMGAARVLQGHSALWGTQDFIDKPKIDGDRIISEAEIHYREYTQAELMHLLTSVGLRVEEARYLGLGVSHSQSTIKRLLKKNPLTQKLMSRRLFASNHYFIASKPQ